MFVLLAVLCIAANGYCHRKTPKELAEGYGYTLENYWIPTPDGYILNLQRLPHGITGKNNSKVVFLMHGILTASTDFLLLGSNSSLGYILADEGYDVWMGNARGNIFSRNHTVLNPSRDETFWNFSWHEIGYYDVPAMIDFVLNNTGVDAIYFAGHSQGTTAFYVMTSTRTEYNKKVKVHVSMAPVVYVNHMFSPLLRILSPIELGLRVLFRLSGVHEILPHDGFPNELTSQICIKNMLTEDLCRNGLFAITGFDPKNLNVSTIPKILQYIPAGSSVKQLAHYAQEINSGHFRQFDHGILRNIMFYGQFAPPDYILSRVTVPVYLFYGGNDWIVASEDVDRLSSSLPNVRGKEMLGLRFNHVDFIYGMNAGTAYTRVIDVFARH